MPKMIFKVCCTRATCQSVKATLEGKGLSVDYQDRLVPDYYAIAKDMSYLEAGNLVKELEGDPEILRAETYPALGELTQ